MATWDYLVIGGGAAGAVLASRLSENPACRVVLVEAGEDVVPGKIPSDIRNLFPLSSYNQSYVWPKLRVHYRTSATSPPVSFQQGRVLGGGSTVMGMWAVRGVPEDYDGWAAGGAAGWGWKDVLPYFRRLETDCDFSGPSHGASGPIPIRRQAPPVWSKLETAAASDLRRDGVALVEDMNAEFDDGLCVLPISRYETSRASAGICYLDAKVRSRPNLRIVTGATVDRLVFDGLRVTGAVAQLPPGEETIEAVETIVCAGAIYTPLLLMRSGIGPGAHLAEAGIAVRHDSPGVGQNLQNHPLLPAFVLLDRHGRDAGRGRPTASVYLRWSSGRPDCTPGDLGMYIRSYLVWHALGRRMAMIAPVLQQPKSRGQVRLNLDDPQAGPLVEFNFLDHPDDVARMVTGFRRAYEVLRGKNVSALSGTPFVMLEAARLNRYNHLSRMNAVRGMAASALVGLGLKVGVNLLGAVAQLRPLDSLIGDDEMLKTYVLQNLRHQPRRRNVPDGRQVGRRRRRRYVLSCPRGGRVASDGRVDHADRLKRQHPPADSHDR